jgi:hypothetical protein
MEVVSPLNTQIPSITRHLMVNEVNVHTLAKGIQFLQNTQGYVVSAAHIRGIQPLFKDIDGLEFPNAFPA